MRQMVYAMLFLSAAFLGLAETSSGQSVPNELIGHWQMGTFSMTNFWNPTTGQFAGNAGEASRSYQIAADGTMEEFFVYNSTSYNCRTQILGYRKGVIKLNSDKSFSFCPTSGYYRSANCFKKEWTKKEYGGKDLCPQYQVNYYWAVENGNLVVKETPGGSTTTYKKINITDRQ